jgi:hypothetical protein
MEHDRDLLRELALVQVQADTHAADAADDDVRSAPERLLRIADELRSTYGAFSDAPNAAMDDATDRGEDVLDVTVTVPVEARALLRRAAETLAEAEAFCRDGRYLLTPAAPDDVAAFRQWAFEEFDRQIAGGAPVPWHEFARARAVRADG